jgi:hypothetical protein
MANSELSPESSHPEKLSREDKRSALAEAGFGITGIDYLWAALGDGFYLEGLTPEVAASMIYEKAGTPARDGRIEALERITLVLRGVFNQDIAQMNGVDVDTVRAWNLKVVQAAQQESVDA